MIINILDAHFLKYGEKDFKNQDIHFYPNTLKMNIESDVISYYMKASEDLFIYPIQGKNLLVITTDINQMPEVYEFNQALKINRNMYFNFISRKGIGVVALNIASSCIIENVSLCR
ncbi:hypothetical protein [Floccifex sp.]|uniref:hypothetical protein n=1 Tax=Floccifex sp. TaxID=2815810 RepID=UPI002A7648A7|nr:hypothetical protein [Floccifex sp.]MDY2957415.1 hypothetical protein [Floccifex sp.]